jgi:predicted amidophosphoribosyltransferase
MPKFTDIRCQGCGGAVMVTGWCQDGVMEISSIRQRCPDCAREGARQIVRFTPERWMLVMTLAFTALLGGLAILHVLSAVF